MRGRRDGKSRQVIKFITSDINRMLREGWVIKDRWTRKQSGGIFSEGGETVYFLLEKHD